MTDLSLERVFPAPLEQVFSYISKTENLLKWWGPEGVHIPEHTLNFEATGPWFSVMKNDAGQIFKVSGQVTHIDAPNSINLTWAWHDDADVRGDESHVTMTLTPDEDGGTRLILTHADLANDEAAANHNEGWTSSLRKLESIVSEHA